MNASEIFVSVDIETSGPVPGLFSLLSIGACLVHAPDVRFYAELKPDCTGFDRKRAARTVLTGMCYSVGSATRQGSSS
ncbi:hypothetical protein ACQ93L_22750, partial [Escherichia coli]